MTIIGCAATIIGQLNFRLGYFYWFNKKKEFLISDAVLAVVYIQSVVWVSVHKHKLAHVTMCGYMLEC